MTGGRTEEHAVSTDKQQVHEFWNTASCGEELYLHGTSRADYESQAAQRYALEPYIADFAEFESSRGKHVLEIGVGLGADHQRFAEAGAQVVGVDLTERAIQHTRQRLQAFGLASRLEVGDAENLRFAEASFDVVYSWGVLHHSPNTPRAVSEVWRVLKPNGRAKIMIYHTWSLVGFMLWLRYALLRLRPWTSLREIYDRYLESPGTKAYTVAEAREMFHQFAELNISIALTHGDLLESAAGQRHRGPLLELARRVWPRWLLRRLASRLGLFMLIDARK
jgi:ubiquinone/menaquinone biosynthesis C-methylase UbiE